MQHLMIHKMRLSVVVAALGTYKGCEPEGVRKHLLSKLRWAKSRESYRRIASESYRSDSNH